MAKDEAESERGRSGGFVGAYLVDGAYRELVGTCRAAPADQHLHDREIVAIATFAAAHPDLPEWPTKLLADRVQRALEDGVIDDMERADLVGFVERSLGERIDDPAPSATSKPTRLSLTEPVPVIEYAHRRFVVTGTFLFGLRKRVEAAIVQQGGVVTESIPGAHYVIIGATVTRAWMFGTHGRKIEAAAQRVAQGEGIAIIAEEDWSPSLT